MLWPRRESEGERGTGRAASGPSPLPLTVALAFLLSLAVVELLLLLELNDGVFAFTLDDPYIHLALGEQLLRGHYGVNPQELSAPSSSILWPFLVAPASMWAPSVLLLNVAAAGGTCWVVLRILRLSFGLEDTRAAAVLEGSLLVFFILGANLVGLAFTGMEHSVQLLTVAATVYGLLRVEKEGRLPGWLPAVLVLAPLVRYEGLSVTAAAVLYLGIEGRIRTAATIATAVVLLLGGYSLFLVSLGLPPLPTPVLLKADLPSAERSPLAILRGGLSETFAHRQGRLMLIGVVGVALHGLWRRDRRAVLPLIGASALVMHFVAGRYGWYHRYEAYAWCLFVLVSLHVAAPVVRRLTRAGRRPSGVAAVVLAGLALPVASSNYVLGLVTVPLASNNIYQQHFQMHRFATEYLDAPVAVNDLGRVSYHNRNYVLDLWGLASIEGYAHRTGSAPGPWMEEAARERGVALAMVYEEWFPALPESWVRLGELRLGGPRITASESQVTFLATDSGRQGDLVDRLRRFQGTLPDGVTFAFDTASGGDPGPPSGGSGAVPPLVRASAGAGAAPQREEHDERGDAREEQDGLGDVVRLDRGRDVVESQQVQEPDHAHPAQQPRSLDVAGEAGRPTVVGGRARPRVAGRLRPRVALHEILHPRASRARGRDGPVPPGTLRES